jgi:hypothetical protein
LDSNLQLGYADVHVHEMHGETGGHFHGCAYYDVRDGCTF